ncbi:MAG: four helix bundle protein [Acidobacteria bacterium]|nr:four helix bundle protein [Acidobacteriota bacterium]
MENRKEGKADAPKKKIGDFQELRVWQEARKLRAAVYRITRSFPKEEACGLVSQMRRAAVSVTANLAEGYGRFSYQENVQFCRQSRGSIYELRDHFTTALDAAYTFSEQYRELEGQAMHVVRLVNGCIRSTLKLLDAKRMGKAL